MARTDALPRAGRARFLAAPTALMLVVIAVLATGVAGSHEDARRDLEHRFADRAASTAALLDALLDASAARSAEDLQR